MHSYLTFKKSGSGQSVMVKHSAVSEAHALSAVYTLYTQLSFTSYTTVSGHPGSTVYPHFNWSVGEGNNPLIDLSSELHIALLLSSPLPECIWPHLDAEDTGKCSFY